MLIYNKKGVASAEPHITAPTVRRSRVKNLFKKLTPENKLFLKSLNLKLKLK